MDLPSWLTEHLLEEVANIDKALARAETYSDRVDLRRLKHEIQEELCKRGETLV